MSAFLLLVIRLTPFQKVCLCGSIKLQRRPVNVTHSSSTPRQAQTARNLSHYRVIASGFVGAPPLVLRGGGFGSARVPHPLIFRGAGVPSMRKCPTLVFP